MSDLLKGRLPRYECFKEVNAGQITGFSMPDVHGEVVQLFLANENVTIEVSIEWMRKHNAQIGGYYVLYDDGYASYSPKSPFESGYRRKQVSSIKVLPIPRG